MTLRRTAIAMALALTIAGGCSTSSKDAARTVKVADTTPPAGPVLLAAFTTGMGAVRAGAPDPVWLEPDAVAAADGTSVFSVRHSPDDADRLVRIDPERGEVTQSWALTTKGLFVAVVAPKAPWIALTDRKPGYGYRQAAATKLVVFDTDAGSEVHHLTLAGDMQPEAFSTDGTFVFALHHLADHYRVETVELGSWQSSDTTDRDKHPPEDMHGQAVHGVMSKDRTLLATLYRNPGDDEEPAFVHVLDLQHGWSYCADLPAPFGTGTPGSDVIQLTSADTVLVAATEAGRIAEIHIDDVRVPAAASGKGPVRVTYRPGNIDSPDEPFRSMPGFEYVFAPPAE
jgi:hypothetical protein